MTRFQSSRRATGWRVGAGVLLVAALLFSGAAPAPAEEAVESGWARTSRVGRQVFDAALLRPMQLVQVAFSAAVFVPAYPVSLLFDGDEDVMELCITEPVERFLRPIGEL